jgi:hypothetical protein
MSTFNISDITLAGAYVNAVTAATDSDHRTAGRRLETGEGSNVVKLLKALVRPTNRCEGMWRPSWRLAPRRGCLTTQSCWIRRPT